MRLLRLLLESADSCIARYALHDAALSGHVGGDGAVAVEEDELVINLVISLGTKIG